MIESALSRCGISCILLFSNSVVLARVGVGVVVISDPDSLHFCKMWVVGDAG